jgi:hypothetical protein
MVLMLEIHNQPLKTWPKLTFKPLRESALLQMLAVGTDDFILVCLNHNGPNLWQLNYLTTDDPFSLHISKACLAH